MRPQKQAFLPLFLLALYGPILVWSAIRPHDFLTWFLEVSPALIGAAILIFSYRRFPLTPLVYVCIFFHAIILTVGAHYTYARVPLFSALAEWLSLSRNPYDRLGHFAQGFVPALITREIFIRLKVLTRSGWRFFLVVCVCLAISAFYELIEWWVALLSEEAAESFLGTQGDVWDTQWDMFLALCGAMLACLLFSGAHDSQIAKITGSAKNRSR